MPPSAIRGGSNRRTSLAYFCFGLSPCLLLFWLVSMAVLINIAWGMPSVFVMLPRHFLLAGLVPMSMPFDILWLVACMIVMLARFFLRHVELLSCDDL